MAATYRVLITTSTYLHSTSSGTSSSSIVVECELQSDAEAIIARAPRNSNPDKGVLVSAVALDFS